MPDTFHNETPEVRKQKLLDKAASFIEAVFSQTVPGYVSREMVIGGKTCILLTEPDFDVLQIHDMLASESEDTTLAEQYIKVSDPNTEIMEKLEKIHALARSIKRNM